MTVWVFNSPGSEWDEYRGQLLESIRNGSSRFGWSYVESADLRHLREKPRSEMSEGERECLSKSRFLLDIAPGDWIVHVHIPRYGLCTAAQVSGGYHFDRHDDVGDDFRHQIKVDPKSVVTFERNDCNVSPEVRRRLGLQGAHWRMYCVDKFLQSISDCKSQAVRLAPGESRELHHLKKDLAPIWRQITERIHQNHPEKKLEQFLCDVFSNALGPDNVRSNGSGWRSDMGADLIVTYEIVHPIIDVVESRTMVIQVKSFSGDHWDTQAVAQLATAVKEYDADVAVLVTTAQSTPALQKAIEDLQEQLRGEYERREGKREHPIRVELIAGDDVARLVLKHGAKLLID